MTDQSNPPASDAAATSGLSGLADEVALRVDPVRMVTSAGVQKDGTCKPFSYELEWVGK